MYFVSLLLGEGVDEQVCRGLRERERAKNIHASSAHTTQGMM